MDATRKNGCRGQRECQRASLKCTELCGDCGFLQHDFHFFKVDKFR